MKDLFISLEEVKSELKIIEELRNNLVLNFSLLSQQLRHIFSQIQLCENFECAKGYFSLLDDIQYELSLFVFKEEMGIPSRLEKFVREYDRFVQDKENCFRKIKNSDFDF